MGGGETSCESKRGIQGRRFNQKEEEGPYLATEHRQEGETGIDRTEGQRIKTKGKSVFTAFETRILLQQEC